MEYQKAFAKQNVKFKTILYYYGEFTNHLPIINSLTIVF